MTILLPFLLRLSIKPSYPVIVMRWGFLASCLGLLSGGVSAQTIESLQWLDRAQQLVARITFNANVRFLQQAPFVSTDLAQLSFQIIAADEAILGRWLKQASTDSAGPQVQVDLESHTDLCSKAKH
jgi:beta-xylosidase